MTVAEQWEQRGIQKGMQDGVVKGKLETALNLLHMGLPIKQIAEATKLDVEVIIKLKQHKS